MFCKCIRNNKAIKDKEAAEILDGVFVFEGEYLLAILSSVPTFLQENM